MVDRRVLVTGASGFVGRQIVAALHALGAEPVVPAAPRPDLLLTAARRDLVAAARADTLIHAAWVTDHGAFWQSDQNLDWVGASLDLLRQFAAAGGKRVVLVGTCAEYDWSHPANARLFLPVGRHEAEGRLLPRLLAAVRDGSDLPVGPAELTRDVMDVRDAGEAIARLVLSPAEGPVNIGTGRPVTLGELVRRVAGAHAHPIRLGARTLRQGEPLWMVADPKKLRRATGFVPRYRLGDTIADALAR